MQRSLSLHRSFIVVSLGLSVWFGIQGLLPHSPADVVAEDGEAEHAALIQANGLNSGTSDSNKSETNGAGHWRSLRPFSAPSPLMSLNWGKQLFKVEQAFATGEVPIAVRQNQQETGRVVVDLSDRTVYLYVNGDLDTSYEVAIGQEEWETPVGQYRIGDMQRDPIWEHPLTGRIVLPGPENPLGAAWIGFLADGEYSFGLHGTLDESLMGEAVSHGCVRMRNDDILALYERVRPGWSLEVLP